MRPGERKLEKTRTRGLDRKEGQKDFSESQEL
jgi:hypothetical protein